MQDSSETRSSSYNKAASERDFASTKVSDLCRIFGFGLLALSYSLIISDSEVPKLLVKNNRFLVFVMGLTSAVTIALDFIQYFSAYIQSVSAMKNDAFDYKVGRYWPTTIIRNICYYLKQISCLVGVISLVIFSLDAFRIAVFR